jgi:hypothetical protein
MLVSRKLFAAFIAAAVAGVTGSPVELEKRDGNYFTVRYCVNAEPGGDPCTPPNGDHQIQGTCVNFARTTWDKDISAFDPMGFSCTLYT